MELLVPQVELIKNDTLWRLWGVAPVSSELRKSFETQADGLDPRAAAWTETQIELLNQQAGEWLAMGSDTMEFLKRAKIWQEHSLGQLSLLKKGELELKARQARLPKHSSFVDRGLLNAWMAEKAASKIAEISKTPAAVSIGDSMVVRSTQPVSLPSLSLRLQGKEAMAYLPQSKVVVVGKEASSAYVMALLASGLATTSESLTFPCKIGERPNFGWRSREAKSFKASSKLAIIGA